MKTRCKFKCQSVTKRLGYVTGGPQFAYDAEFQAVYGDSPENKAFFAATPSGSIKVATVKDDQFVPGHEYYVDFIPVVDVAE